MISQYPQFHQLPNQPQNSPQTTTKHPAKTQISDSKNPRPKSIQRCCDTIQCKSNNNAWKHHKKPPHPVKLTTPNPSKHRIMRSRTLGEDTEKIRNSLSPVEVDSEFVATIKEKDAKKIPKCLREAP